VFRTHDSETRDRMRDICFSSYITLLFANIEQISHCTPVRNPLAASTQPVSVTPASLQYTSGREYHHRVIREREKSG